MPAAVLQNVEQYVGLSEARGPRADDRLLARHNEPLNSVSHHEEIQRRALDSVGLNEQDALLARDPTNPILIKEEAAAQKVSYIFLSFRRGETDR